mmetsp:Transcript_43992/g.76027  ORF Transcript_43992/g.76027 Transcript_43992/m.76027 type:complete len:347 (+) Transcript_43992:453-1493(+)
MKPERPRPPSSSACACGPARAMAAIVPAPSAATLPRNCSSSISPSARAFSTSRRFMRSRCAASSARASRASASRRSASTARASARSRARSTAASPSMPAAWARALASAWAWPEVSMAALSARRASSRLRDSSACASFLSFCCCSRPLASSSSRWASWRARASWLLVVISMAICTLFCSESRVSSSTGSTLWMSTLVMTRLLAQNTRLPLILPISSSPKTETRITRAECLWKLSKVSMATAPRTREAMVLQASPVKSRTLKIFSRSGSSRPTSKCQLYESFSRSRAWSEVSTAITSVMKSGPRLRQSEVITLGRLGLSPLRLSTENCSSGISRIRSGPKTTRAAFCL